MNDNKNNMPQRKGKPTNEKPDNSQHEEDLTEVVESQKEIEREKRHQQSKGRRMIEPKEDSSFFMQEQYVHPYFEEDPTLGLCPKNYQEPLTLMHGTSKSPKSYQTIAKCDLNSCEKLHVTNWMENVRPPSALGTFDYVEVRFKNSHKDFYQIPEGLEINEGDIVAVEGTPGHDIGIVSLKGELCRIQMKKKKGFNMNNVKKLYRRAKSTDIEKWLESIKKEDDTLFATRRFVMEDKLEMKINDVEYQGDGTKAIFYYTADDRVDFRLLIKQLAQAFGIKIEMKQIGARQEAGRLGGIGTCGRELCCSTWLNNFSSVGTSVAKAQQLFPNPQKLAGQCGKLKCCLNYEYDVYQDAMKDFPPIGAEIDTLKGKAVFRKVDVLKGILWYSYKDSPDFIPITASNVKKMLSMKRANKDVKDLESFKANV